MNPELKAAFDALNARLASIEARLAALEASISTRSQAEELRRLVSDTQAAALNAQH